MSLKIIFLSVWTLLSFEERDLTAVLMKCKELKLSLLQMVFSGTRSSFTWYLIANAFESLRCCLCELWWKCWERRCLCSLSGMSFPKYIFGYVLWEHIFKVKLMCLVYFPYLGELATGQLHQSFQTLVRKTHPRTVLCKFWPIDWETY